jgi:hypothetical protein
MGVLNAGYGPPGGQGRSGTETFLAFGAAPARHIRQLAAVIRASVSQSLVRPGHCGGGKNGMNRQGGGGAVVAALGIGAAPGYRWLVRRGRPIRRRCRSVPWRGLTIRVMAATGKGVGRGRVVIAVPRAVGRGVDRRRPRVAGPGGAVKRA